MSSYDVNDSIAAIASPPGVAARGVIRLSGPNIDQAIRACFHPCDDLQGPDHLKGPGNSSETSGNPIELIQKPIVLVGQIKVADPIRFADVELYYWPDAASYTRQRSAEIHCTGSVPVLNEIMRALAELGVRQAQPGEFTMRAFLAGRIDLIAAEAVLGVIDSQSEREMETALKQLAGGLSGPIQKVQDRLLDVLAHLEAGLDFVEEDIDFISQQAVQTSIDESKETVQGILQQIDQRSVQKRRPRVVLLGRPNAGKSRLQNVFSESSTAIVSEVAGTTRDYLVSVVKVGDLEFELIDTAGTLAESADEINSIQQQAEVQTALVETESDLKLICVDGNKTPDVWEQSWIDGVSSGAHSDTVLIQTKSDLEPNWNSDHAIVVSSETGHGIESLQSVVLRRLESLGQPNSGEIVGATSNRCFESLRSAGLELDRASSFCRGGHGEEIVAASLRVVLDELAVVTGKVFTDDILDRVFSRFCIGK